MEISLIKLPSRQEVFITNFPPQFFHWNFRGKTSGSQSSAGIFVSEGDSERETEERGSRARRTVTEIQAKGDSGGEKMRGLEGFEDLGQKTLQVRCCRIYFLNLFSQAQRANVRWACGCVVVRAWRKRASEQMGRWTRDLLRLNQPRVRIRLTEGPCTPRPSRWLCSPTCIWMSARWRAPVLIFTVLARAYRDRTRSREVGLGYFSCQDHTCTPASGVWAFFTHQPLIGHNCLHLLERKRSTRGRRSRWKMDSWCDDTWCQVAGYYGYYGYYGYCTCICSALVNAECIAVVLKRSLLTCLDMLATNSS